jgi:hypothetical protein
VRLLRRQRTENLVRLPRNKAEWDQQAARERVTDWVEGRRRQFEQVREALRQSSAEPNETTAPRSQTKLEMATALWLLIGSRRDGFDRPQALIEILGLDASHPDYEAALVRAVGLCEEFHWLAATVVSEHAKVSGVSVEQVLGTLEEAVGAPPPNAVPPSR